MTRKAGAPADEYGLRIVARLRAAIRASGRTDKSVFEAAGLSSNYFYVRMRGERPFTTDDLVALARVLELGDPSVLFEDGPLPATDAIGIELRRQIRATAETALLDQLGGAGALSDRALAELSDAALVELARAFGRAMSSRRPAAAGV